MALHGLGSMTLGVPRVDEARELLPRVRADRVRRRARSRPRRRGAIARRRATRSGNWSRSTLAADDPDDLGRIAGAAAAHDLDVTEHDRRQHLGRRADRRHPRPRRRARSDRAIAVRDATDERSGQHRPRRRSGAGDLRRGAGRAAPARPRAVGHARHRRQQALPRRRARFPVERRVGRHHRLPALLTRPPQRRADQLAGAVLPPLVVAGQRRRRDRPGRPPPARRPTRRAACGDSAGTSSAPTCSGTSATRPATSPSTSPTSTRSATTTRGSPATGRPTSRCTRGVRRSPATSSNRPTSPRSRRRC